MFMPKPLLKQGPAEHRKDQAVFQQEHNMDVLGLSYYLVQWMMMVSRGLVPKCDYCLLTVTGKNGQTLWMCILGDLPTPMDFVFFDVRGSS